MQRGRDINLYNKLPMDVDDTWDAYKRLVAHDSEKGVPTVQFIQINVENSEPGWPLK